MSLVFHWFLPTSGDGRGIVGGGTVSGGTTPRTPPLDQAGAMLPVTLAPLPGRLTSTTSLRSPGPPSRSASLAS